MPWIDVPAHRILSVEYDEFHEAFERIGHKGGLAEPGERPAFIVRKKDSKRFNTARFYPSEQTQKDILTGSRGHIYLEEI